KKVEGKLARIKLELEDDATIAIDDNEIAPALVHEKIPMDPGEHTLTATATGKKPRTVTFTVPEGPSTTTVTVPAPEAAEVKKVDDKKDVVDDTPPPPPIDDTKPSSGLKTVGFVAIGVGVVGLGVGTALGFSAKSLDGDAEKLCTPKCTPEGKSLNDDARSRGNLATIVFAAGAVIAVTGVGLILVAPSKSSTTTAHVSPWMSATPGGLSLAGSF